VDALRASDIGSRIILGEIVDALRASDLGTRILRI